MSLQRDKIKRRTLPRHDYSVHDLPVCGVVDSIHRSLFNPGVAFQAVFHFDGENVLTTSNDHVPPTGRQEEQAVSLVGRSHPSAATDRW